MGYTGDKKREYDRKWIAARRAQFFKDKRCAGCGSTESLQLDHIDPQTKTHHAIWSWSEQRRLAELAKCQVLCKDCHLAKTVRQMPTTHAVVPYQHGTSQTYNRGCRCDECRAHKYARGRTYRARKR